MSDMFGKGEMTKWVIIGGLGLLAWLAWMTKQGADTPSPSIDWCGSFGIGCTDQPINRDPQGCVVGVSTWCDSLKHCVVNGLTCPTLKSTPIVYPVHPVCSPGWMLENNICVQIPGFEPLPQTPTIDVPIYSDVCMWPNGERLTVPAGMNCNQAVADMCQRFKMYPGYKGCS
jgi:hypothetical protein